MRKIKNKKRTFYKEPSAVPELNVMECYKIVEGVARKVNKERLTKQVMNEVSRAVLTAECTQKITDEAVAGALMVISNVLMNHWGKLNRRKTRLQRMYSIFRELFDSAENPDQTQIEAEQEFERQTGLKVIRD